MVYFGQNESKIKGHSEKDLAPVQARWIFSKISVLRRASIGLIRSSENFRGGPQQKGLKMIRVTPLVQGGREALGVLGLLSTLILTREANSTPSGPGEEAPRSGKGSDQVGVRDFWEKGAFYRLDLSLFGAELSDYPTTFSGAKNTVNWGHFWLQAPEMGPDGTHFRG